MAKVNQKTGFDEVVPRDLTFDLNKDNVKRHWFNNDPWNSIWMGAILGAVPQAERWVMRSAAMLLDKIEDPLIRESAVNFCKQERIHAREHDVMNEIIVDDGLPLDKIEAGFDALREYGQEHLSPEMQGSLAASFEHFTAILSSVFLENPYLFKDTHPDLIHMLYWHFVEETEHKSVSFDVFTQASGSGPKAYLTRIMGMATTTVVGIPAGVAAIGYLLWKDKQLTNLPSAARMVDTTLFRPGLLRRIVQLYFPYYAPGFHPWDDDNREVIGVWKAAYEKSGDPAEAYTIFCEWHDQQNAGKTPSSKRKTAAPARLKLA